MSTKPKAPQTAFFYFAMNNRTDVREELGDPNAPASTVAKILGDRWRALPAAEKELYQDVATQDRNRYLKEMKRYKEIE